MEVRKDLIHNRGHSPVPLQPLEEALIPEPAELPVTQLPGSRLYIPHHLHLHIMPSSVLVHHVSAVKHASLHPRRDVGHASAVAQTRQVGSIDM